MSVLAKEKTHLYLGKLDQHFLWRSVSLPFTTTCLINIREQISGELGHIFSLLRLAISGKMVLSVDLMAILPTK